MHTATKDHPALSALLAELEPVPATESLLIDTFDSWSNPATGRGSFSWICYNRVNPNLANPTVVTKS